MLKSHTLNVNAVKTEREIIIIVSNDTEDQKRRRKKGEPGEERQYLKNQERICQSWC